MGEREKLLNTFMFQVRKNSKYANILSLIVECVFPENIYMHPTDGFLEL